MNQLDNPYLKRLDELELARTKWQESEWRLSFLRPVSPTQPQQLTDEQLLTWNRQYSANSN